MPAGGPPRAPCMPAPGGGILPMNLIPPLPAWPPGDALAVAGLAAGRLLAAASIGQVIANTRLWLVGMLAGLATLFLTIGGVRYLLAGGDPAEVEKAKAALRSAAIGYGLAILAPVIVTVLRSLVGG